MTKNSITPNCDIYWNFDKPRIRYFDEKFLVKSCISQYLIIKVYSTWNFLIEFVKIIAVFHQIHDISNIAIWFEILILCVDLRHWFLMQIDLNISLIKNGFGALPNLNFNLLFAAKLVNLTYY